MTTSRRTRRRDRVDVVADILSFVKEQNMGGGTLFNHIRFGSLISNDRRLKWYLHQLLESGHLETHINRRFYKDLELNLYPKNNNHGTRFFSITDKGRRFLSLYEHMNEERVGA